MTKRFYVSGTSDPRTKEAREPTPITASQLYEDVEDTQVIGELCERIETLVNITGQFRSEILDLPNKYNTQIRDLGDPEYQLIEPIFVLIEEYPNDDRLIASFPEIEVFGEGVTITEAIYNLKFSILDLYDELVNSDPEELGELPEAWLRILNSMIVKKKLG